MVTLLLLLSCAQEEPEKRNSGEMDPVALLSRLSLDLRGVRPTDAEIARVEADHGAVDALAEEFLQDERFGERFRAYWAEILLTRTESWPLAAADFGLDDEATYQASLGDEPLRILSTIATEDLPWTEAVLGDWTMADEVLARVLPVDYPSGAEGWQKVAYTDGRPAAGVLSTNALWWRYGSTDSNANRSRANALSRIFLCNDYLDRTIEFDRDIDLLDEDAVLDAILTNPACVNCHNSLDPLASYLYGFWWYEALTAQDASTYHPEREQMWMDTTGVAPGYYGEPGTGLVDLGWQIASDPRFPGCAVEHMARLLLRRDLSMEDQAAFDEHRSAFLAGGLTPRALVRSLVADPDYRAAPGGQGGEDAPGAVPRKMLTPDQLASAVEDLTGFSWTWYGYDMLGTDALGLRTLAGGLDGSTVTAVASTPNATVLLVQERLAEAAASWAVEREQAQAPGERRLFDAIDFTETPESGRAAMVGQIQALFLRVHGRRVGAGSEEVEALLALWESLYDAEGEVPAAWAGVLSALLRDPDFLYY